MPETSHSDMTLLLDRAIAEKAVFDEAKKALTAAQWHVQYQPGEASEAALREAEKTFGERTGHRNGAIRAAVDGGCEIDDLSHALLYSPGMLRLIISKTKAAPVTIS